MLEMLTKYQCNNNIFNIIGFIDLRANGERGKAFIRQGAKFTLNRKETGDIKNDYVQQELRVNVML